MKKALLTKKTRAQNRPQTNRNDFDTGQLLSALMAFKRGDFSARLPEDWTGVPGKIAAEPVLLKKRARASSVRVPPLETFLY
jgi:hypothetical protein